MKNNENIIWEITPIRRFVLELNKEPPPVKEAVRKFPLTSFIAMFPIYLRKFASSVWMLELMNTVPV